jgi:hypothetical protein
MELQKLKVNLEVCSHVAFEVKRASMTAAGNIMELDIQEMPSPCRLSYLI